jgi:hypothetical protein
MTGQADFTEDEWKQVLEGPTSAGMMVAMSSSGGTLRETFSMAKAYTEARSRSGESELLDTIASTKPEVDKARFRTKEEMSAHALTNIRDALALLDAKATPEEVEDYKRFVIGLAERVAEAHKGVSEGEREAIAQIAAELGVDPPAPAA